MGLTFTVRSEAGGSLGTIDIDPAAVVLGGFAARSAEERERHIEELRELGIVPPERIPAFWHVSPGLATTGSRIDVQGEQTSGEVEYALIGHGGATYVAVASDETDRHFERYSIPRSKQMCAKVLSSDVLPLDRIRERWDDITLSSEVSEDGQTWRDYQEGALATLFEPEALVRHAFGSDALPDRTFLLSGTIPIVDGVTRYLPHFRAALTLPGSSVQLRLAYRVDVLPEIAGGEVPQA